MAEFMNFGIKPNIEDPSYRSHAFRYYFARGFLEKEWIVVDSACGTGYGTAILGKGVNKVTGIDRNAGCIKTAMNDFPSPNVQFMQYDLDKLENLSLSVDAWVTIETIEHLVDPEKYAHEVKKKTMNRIILTCPIGKTTGTNPHHLHDIEVEDLHRWFIGDGWFMMHSAMQGQYILLVYVHEYSNF